MSKRRNKIKTTMNPIIDDILPIQSAFVPQKPLELLVDISDYLRKRVGVIDGVAVARGVDDGQS